MEEYNDPDGSSREGITAGQLAEKIRTVCLDYVGALENLRVYSDSGLFLKNLASRDYASPGQIAIAVQNVITQYERAFELIEPRQTLTILMGLYRESFLEEHANGIDFSRLENILERGSKIEQKARDDCLEVIRAQLVSPLSQKFDTN